MLNTFKAIPVSLFFAWVVQLILCETMFRQSFTYKQASKGSRIPLKSKSLGGRESQFIISWYLINMVNRMCLRSECLIIKASVHKTANFYWSVCAQSTKKKLSQNCLERCCSNPVSGPHTDLHIIIFSSILWKSVGDHQMFGFRHTSKICFVFSRRNNSYIFGSS